ncbi:hypothetical protein BC834DRAFT_976032 [Gloeopeniophorella convolvens]|nr:hypothetical protein BC834DRAFT_976032 [Gloeopeniophorella convolvens]
MSDNMPPARGNLKRRLRERGSDGRFKKAPKLATDENSLPRTPSEPPSSPLTPIETPSWPLTPIVPTPATSESLSLPTSLAVSPFLSTSDELEEHRESSDDEEKVARALSEASEPEPDSPFRFPSTSLFHTTPLASTSPPPQQRKPSPPPPHRHFPMTTAQSNTGNVPTTFGGFPHEDPIMFLRTTRRIIAASGIATPEAKAEYLADSIVTNSPADEWFNRLAQATKIDWTALVGEFTTRWTPPPAPAKTAEQLAEELTTHILAPSSIGVQVPFRGTQTYSHIAWAEEAITKARACGLESRGEYIPNVLRNMPQAIQNSITSAARTNWTTFTAAVKALDIDNLQQAARQEQERQEHLATMTRLEQQIAAKLSQLSIQPQNLAHANPPTPRNPANAPNHVAPMGTYNPAVARPRYTSTRPGTPTQRAPATEDAKTALRQRLTIFPHQPDTPTGQAIYAQQMASWNASRTPGTRVNIHTPVPLRPGTAAISSGECYVCGTNGHPARACPIQSNDPRALSHEESRWRSICGGTLGTVNKGVAEPVYLMLDDYEDGAGYTDGQGSGQGKGQGSSADTLSPV